jgi:hypothetical protein
MKYSQYIGILLILLFVVMAFLPWIYIPSIHAYVTGVGGDIHFFGMPALFGFFCCVFSVVFFLIPRTWAKRANIFATSLNLAWALKNIILLNICRQGECPEAHPALYIMFVLSIGIVAMAFLPDIAIPNGRTKKAASHGDSL